MRVALSVIGVTLGLGLSLGFPLAAQAQTQAPILSCNNLEDLVDVNVRDNFQDNSKNIDKSRDVNRDSFNTTELLPL